MVTVSMKHEMTTSHSLVHLLPALKPWHPLENVIFLSQNGNSSISCYCRIQTKVHLSDILIALFC